MTGVGKNDNGKAAQRRNSAFPPNQSYGASMLRGVPFNKVGNNEDDQVADGY